MILPLDFQLVTARCRLRMPAPADIPHVFSATRYAGFNDGMRWDPPASEEDLRAPLERSLEGWKTGRDFAFSIERKEDSIFLGRIDIRSSPNPAVWNIGFWLHPAQQGNGYMTEAGQAIVDFGFARLGAETIEACHATWNGRSRRVLERLGMTEVGFVSEGFKKRGEWVPEYRMRIEKK